MPFVFSYGSLQDARVQVATFGRELRGSPDELPQFELTKVRAHANVMFNGSPDSRVTGMAFQLTDDELLAADAYETAAHYTRARVTLASGREAWVYRDASGGWDTVAGDLIARRSRTIGVDVVRDWARRLPRNAAVLDVGCGSGIPLAQALAADGFRLFGVDASPALVDAFRRNVAGAAALCEPAESSTFFGRRFDGAIAVGLMFLLPPRTQRHLIRRIAAALEPGARFLFTAPSEACTWIDIQTGCESRSLGAEAYAAMLRDEGLALEGEFTDAGDNHYYSSVA